MREPELKMKQVHSPHLFYVRLQTVPKGDEGHKNYFIMSENVYSIQFDYDGKTHDIPNLSYNNLKDNLATKLWMAEVIEDYIKENKIHQDGAKVSNANLIGKDGEVLVHVDDFSKL